MRIVNCNLLYLLLLLCLHLPICTYPKNRIQQPPHQSTSRNPSQGDRCPAVFNNKQTLIVIYYKTKSKKQTKANKTINKCVYKTE